VIDYGLPGGLPGWLAWPCGRRKYAGVAITAKSIKVSGEQLTLKLGQGSATRSFRVYDNATNPPTATSETDVVNYVVATWPLGTSLASVPGLVVSGHRIEAIDRGDDGTFNWQVTIEYQDQGLGGPLSPLPWNRPGRFSGASQESEEPFFVDATSPTPKKVVNGAGDAFDPMPTVLTVRPLPRFTINLQPGSTRFSRVARMWFALDGRTAFTNNDTFSLAGTTIPRLGCVMWVADLSDAYEGTTKYYVASYGFKFYEGPNSIDTDVLNQGWFVKTGLAAPKDYARAMRAGQPTVVPVMLSASGQRLADASPAHYIRFKKPLQVIDFAGLGIE
jgi:hypothetical protein